MFLLDTTAVSEPYRPRPDLRLTTWLANSSSDDLFTSVMVIGEIRKGIYRLGDSVARGRVEAWLESEVLAPMGNRVLPVSQPIAEAWGEMCGRAERAGRPLPVVDSLIAATAIVHDFAVVTRNVRDFERCGARVVNPWSGSVV